MPTFFKTPDAFREWLKVHHSSTQELWVGFFKKTSGQPSITWPESVDEALCFGWIDGIRKSIDNARYMIRFTPRRSGSIWSAVNVRRVEALKTEGRMQPSGLKAFASRKENRSGIYSYENRPEKLPASYERVFKADRQAWAFFQAQPPGYRRTATWFVVSAKKEETRLKRLAILMDCCAKGKRLPGLTPPERSQ